MPKIKLGLNMAGAVSAGAYTAGVLDFLIEALDEWYAAKAAGEPVPLHDVSLEVLSGASAGGMCAAIAGVQVHDDFEHIRDTSATNTSNRFYESWVNKVDIRELLKLDDLASGHITSLLDSTIIRQIAEYALVPGAPKLRKYVSPHLTLFLTLTNLRGVPYRLSSDASGSMEEYMSYYGDRLRFETVEPGVSPIGTCAKPLPIGQPGQGAWPLLRQAAMATGAFPGALAPAIIERPVSDYTTPIWEEICAAPPTKLKPAWEFEETATWQTLNVDGGITDNNPFDLAEDYLASLEPPSPDGENFADAVRADRAVLSVAPFPGYNSFTAAYDATQSSGLLSTLPALLTALISQSRFQGEALASIASGVSFSRFVIAPSDPDEPTNKALQCATLGAFGGFFERGFRAHDYQLGRRNCQRFLDCHFVLPSTNAVISEGLDAAGARRQEVLQAHQQPAPNDKATPRDVPWLPIVPLCGSVREEVQNPARASVSDHDLDQITDLILKRIKALLPLVLKDVSAELFRIVIRGEINAYLTFAAKGELKSYLRKNLA